jgi:hypothetical protein
MSNPPILESVMSKKYAIADLNNGILESFKSREDAEKALSVLIDEGNKINQENASEYDEQGLDIPDAADFYCIVEAESPVIVKLTQDAYIDQGGAPAETYYTAIATDEDGNEYRIKWEITLSEEDQAECDDESNMCDWDAYTAFDVENNNKKVDVEIKW